MKKSVRISSVGLLSLAAILFVVFLILHRPTPQVHQQPLAQAPPPANPPPLPVATNAKNLPSPSRVLANWTNFEARPFSVTSETQGSQWTSADGKDTNIIHELAHNQLEYERMVNENPKIFRRQLVYLKRTAAAVFEDAKLTKLPVQELTLPGLDGQEFEFDISESDSNGSSRHGMFSGHLAGNPDSMVTMAFQDGREAFTVLSPKQNIYVVGEPREDGQVIVKTIDPNTYGVGPAGEDDYIKTESAKK